MLKCGRFSELRADGMTGPPAYVRARALLQTPLTSVPSSKAPSPFHNNRSRYPLSPAERFAARYIPEPNTGCWLWLGWTDADGYGGFKIDGVTLKAHRVSWMLARGEMPKLQVLHRCDTPGCVNPDHLFLGDNDTNIADKIRKGRHRNGQKRITDQQRAEIQARRASGESARALAAEYGISHWYVYNLARPSQVSPRTPRWSGPPDPMYPKWLEYLAHFHPILHRVITRHEQRQTARFPDGGRAQN